jgi:hypothetical protein
MVDSGIIPVFPETRDLKVDSKAAIADGAIPSATILVCGKREKERTTLRTWVCHLGSHATDIA